jgi:hypothetical protein
MVLITVARDRRSEAWGPSGTLLHEIAAATTDDEQKSLILQSLWERLRCSPPASHTYYFVLRLLIAWPPLWQGAAK